MEEVRSSILLSSTSVFTSLALRRGIIGSVANCFDTLGRVSEPVIAVVDYRAGNAPSVIFALERLGVPCRLASAPEQLVEAERIILPGVGAARATLDSLRESGLVEPLTERVVGARVPFLGICIGLQVLFDHSEEGDVDGLGWIPGSVRRFPGSGRVPQIGWNEVRPQRPHPLWKDLPESAHCYFVNSYYAVPAEVGDVLATTEYGVVFCSMAARGNIAATQFHAEKSGRLGLQMLTNFATWGGSEC
jgi:glutamine amidotransferase